MPRWHGKPIVETTLAPARDVDKRSVEHRPAVLIHVQTPQQHGLDQSPRLRDAEDEARSRRGGSRQRIAPQVGEEIADSRHPGGGNDRIACRVDELIDASGLESAIKRNLAGSAAFARFHERPRRARNRSALVRTLLALGEHHIGVAVVRKRICRADKAGEAGGRPRCIHDQLVSNLSRDRCAVFRGDGCTQHQPVVTRPCRDVRCPRRPDQSNAPPEQEPVARIRDRRRIVAERGFVELAKNGDVSAVVDLIQQRAVATRGHLGTQHQEFRAELHQPTSIAWRQLEVGHRRVRRRVRIERKEGATAQLFIGAGITEFDAGGEVLSAQDLDPLDPGSSRRRETGYRQKQCCGDDASHAPISGCRR